MSGPRLVSGSITRGAVGGTEKDKEKTGVSAEVRV